MHSPWTAWLQMLFPLLKTYPQIPQTMPHSLLCFKSLFGIFEPKQLFMFLLCVRVFCLGVCLRMMCAQCPQRPEQGVRAGVTDGWKPHVGLGMRAGSLEEQPVLLTAESSLQLCIT